MIKISLTSTGYSVMGHANQAEHGYDVVCSAVSALTQTIALALNKECNAQVKDDYGVYMVVLDGRSKNGKSSRLLIQTLTKGLEKVEKEYPQHLELRIQRGLMD